MRECIGLWLFAVGLVLAGVFMLPALLWLGIPGYLDAVCRYEWFTLPVAAGGVLSVVGSWVAPVQPKRKAHSSLPSPGRSA